MKKALTIKEPTLQEMVDMETSNRRILTEFINQHMVRGTDYGSISFGGRESKDCLFKPGAEKIGSLLRLRPDVVKDNDTWEMAGSKPGLFCYKCILYNTKNEVVGMGLGACSIEEKKNYNNSIKIAKKRAYVDAILTTGALSDFFTQDLEDTDASSTTTPQKPYTDAQSNPMTPRQMAEEKERRAYTDDDGVTHEPYQSKPANVVYATEKQIAFIKKLLAQKGWTEKEVFIKYKVKSLPELLLINAKQIIDNLLKLPNKENGESEADQIVNDASEAGL